MRLTRKDVRDDQITTKRMGVASTVAIAFIGLVVSPESIYTGTPIPLAFTKGD